MHKTDFASTAKTVFTSKTNHQNVLIC